MKLSIIHLINEEIANLAQKQHFNVEEGYDDIGVEEAKNKKKLSDYTDYNDKKILTNFTLLHFRDNNPFADKWEYWGNILAFDNADGTEVGNASYGKIDAYSNMKASVDVRPDKRRMGIASSMYEWIEELTGQTLAPDVPHSSSAAKLWSNPNRKFGIKK